MDINTIFYFPSSLTFDEYSNKLDQGEISERTIVFADAQKSIYKGGKKYGGTSLQEFHDLIDTLYDDSWISDEITNIKADIIQAVARMDQFNTLVTNIGNTLDQEIEDRDANIQTKVEQLMIDAQWLQDNFPQGVTQWDSGWNQDIEAYLQTVGYWTTDGNNQKVTQWSKLQQRINSVESSVNSLTVDGNLTQTLTSSIQQLINGKIASLQLGTTYATVEKVDDVEKVLGWMYSGLESSASEETTFSEMSSMAKNDFMSAISDIRTQVNKVANGDFVAQTEIASKVGDTIAAMLLQSSSDNGLAGMSARLNAVEQESSTTTQNVADLILGVTGSSSTADISTAVSNVLSGFAASSDVTSDITSAKSEIYSAIGAKDTNDNFISIASLKTLVDDHTSQISGLASTADVSAGFVAKTDLDSAVATLVAQNGSSVKANIETAVTNGISAATISANQIILEGLVTANNNFKIKSDGSMETIAGKIGGFNITSSSIYNGTTSLSDTTNGGVYVGTDGIRCNGTVNSDIWSGGIVTNYLRAASINIRPKMIYNDGLGDYLCNNQFYINNLDKDNLTETEIHILRKTGGTTLQDRTVNAVSIKPSGINFSGSSYSSQMTSSSISITGSSSSASMDSDKLQVLSGGYGSYIGSSKIQYSYGQSVEMMNQSTVNADCAVTINNNGFIITGPAPYSAQARSTPTLKTVAKISKEGYATFERLYIGGYQLDVTAAEAAGILV